MKGCLNYAKPMSAFKQIDQGDITSIFFVQVILEVLKDYTTSNHELSARDLF